MQGEKCKGLCEFCKVEAGTCPIKDHRAQIDQIMGREN